MTTLLLPHPTHTDSNTDSSSHSFSHSSHIKPLHHQMCIHTCNLPHRHTAKHNTQAHKLLALCKLPHKPTATCRYFIKKTHSYTEPRQHYTCLGLYHSDAKDRGGGHQPSNRPNHHKSTSRTYNLTIV